MPLGPHDRPGTVGNLCLTPIATVAPQCLRNPGASRRSAPSWLMVEPSGVSRRVQPEYRDNRRD